MKGGPGDRIEGFRKVVRDHYREQGRDLPWRRTTDPYEILVSEFMLQQTQVSRVLAKYGPFLAAFPTIRALSRATVAEVLSTWQGLGYNRRALALRGTARLLVTGQGGMVPDTVAALRALPGVGAATAAAVAVFAHGIPVPFIETNIRSAFIHFFFPDYPSVTDAAILPLVDSTLDRANPRDWYYALMDYGSWLKKNHSNPSRKSAHHSVQPPFPGSRRQLRATVLRSLLSVRPVPLTKDELRGAATAAGADPACLDSVLVELADEGFLTKAGEGYALS